MRSSGVGKANALAIDAGLVAVIQVWPHLPEAIRAGILAMVRASEPAIGSRCFRWAPLHESRIRHEQPVAALGR